MVKLAKEKGMTSLALTDHGAMYFLTNHTHDDIDKTNIYRIIHYTNMPFAYVKLNEIKKWIYLMRY